MEVRIEVWGKGGGVGWGFEEVVVLEWEGFGFCCYILFFIFFRLMV